MLYTYVNEKWKKVPSLISEYEMDMFRLVTSSGAAGLDYFGGDSIVYGIGDRVRVTGGVFKGAEGYIKRIKGKRRLIVSITGICAVATSFIPNCFCRRSKRSFKTAVPGFPDRFKSIVFTDYRSVVPAIPGITDFGVWKFPN